MTDPDITTQSLVDSIQSIYEASQIQNQSLATTQEVDKSYDRETHQAQIRLQEMIIGYSLSNADNIYDEDYDDIFNRNGTEVPDRFIEELSSSNVAEEGPEDNQDDAQEDNPPTEDNPLTEDIPIPTADEESQTETLISEYERGYRDGYKDGYTDGQSATSVRNEESYEEPTEEEFYEEPIEEASDDNITLEDIDADEDLEEETLNGQEEYTEEQLYLEDEEEVDLSKSQNPITLHKGDVADEDEVYRI